MEIMYKWGLFLANKSGQLMKGHSSTAVRQKKVYS